MSALVTHAEGAMWQGAGTSGPFQASSHQEEEEEEENYRRMLATMTPNSRLLFIVNGAAKRAMDPSKMVGHFFFQTCMTYSLFGINSSVTVLRACLE